MLSSCHADAAVVVTACRRPADRCDNLRAMAKEPIEVTIERVRGEELDDERRGELAQQVRETRTFVDAELGSRALRWALDVARELDELDGDTVTYHLARALELAPHDDALLHEYLREVADTDYFYTDLTLGEIAEKTRDVPRARELALAATFAELWVLGSYLAQSSPPQWAIDAAKRAFARARALGADEAGWLAMRERLARDFAFRSDPDAGAWARYAG